MQPADLERYLHEHIPLSHAMRASVVAVDPQSVVLRAPLAPNINHRETVFGGSAASLAILAAWSLLHVRLLAEGLTPRLVIQRSTMDYDAPMAGAFEARSSLAEPGHWPRFTHMLAHKGKARIAVNSVLEIDGQPAGRFSGDFVAISAPGMPGSGP